MIHEILAVGPLRCNCSILGDPITHKATVVDPGDEISAIVRLLEKDQLQVEQIVITHAHIDHVGGAVRLKKLTGAPIYMNQLDLPLLQMMDMQAGWLGIAPPEVQSPDVSAEDGLQIIAAGETAQILHTPGHTQGSICLHLPEQHLLLAGDTLFAGSVGRTDLPGGDFPALMRSLHQRVLLLPDATRVIPGHGHATTIGQERESNPFLIQKK
ncbi:MAG TPA: MBL fold metallo-hydrolase [Acidobacteriaceae bacterium]|nr:MBL fold metallo-hydrolase [Acidobacteriaceae bacterium]